MTNNNSPKEIWFTTTKAGKRRAWYFSFRDGRTFPMPLAGAELAVATGAAVQIEKPWIVGGAA